MMKYKFASVFIASLLFILVGLTGCSKSSIEGTFQNKFKALDVSVSYELVFTSSGEVGMTSIFDKEKLSYGVYSMDGDTITVKIDGCFSGKPKVFKVHSDSLVSQSDGKVWEKIE
ncbi:hypothetical protein OAL58_02850 [Verrucomicrobia bacterium]|nr:hypothetical protein [Verrucomicrobiota bacterium]